LKKKENTPVTDTNLKVSSKAPLNNITYPELKTKKKEELLQLVQKLQKKLESKYEEYKVNDKQFRKFFEDSPAGIGVTDMNGNILVYNDAILKPGKYSRKDFKIKNVMELYFNPKQRDEVLSLLNKQGFIKNFQILLKRKDGTPYDALISLSKSTFDGHFCLQAIIEDITDKKIAERKFREKEEEVHRILNNSLDGILLTGPDGSIYSANAAACEMFGRTEEEICCIGRKGVTDLSDTRLKDFLRIRSEKGKVKSEVSLLRKDGSKFPAEVSSSLFTDKDGKLRSSMVIRDISERKKAEQEIKKVKELLEQVFASLTDTLFVVDVEDERKIVSCNQAIENVFGYKVDEIIGRSTEFLHVDSEAYMKFGKMVIKAFDTKENLVTDFKMKRKNGEIFNSEHIVSEIKDKSGVRRYVVSIVRDITESKQAEEETKKSKELLRQLYINLNDIRENERKVIAREIHDELGQQLTALKIDLSNVKDKSYNKQELNVKLNNLINMVSNTLENVQRLSYELRPDMIDDLGLTPAIEWYVQEFKKRSAVQVNLELEEIALQNEKIDLTLFRLCQEGMTNVLRHANAKSINIKLYTQLKNVYLEIKDDGIGFDPKIINSSKSLGLIGMRERIEQWNGFLKIISSKKNGTTLIFSIPINGKK